MAWTKFGPGTVTLTVNGGTAESFEQEVKGGGLAHEYSDIGEDVTYLDGVTDPAGKQRADTLSLDCDFDLGSAAGFYGFLFDNDTADATLEFVPNTAAGASWSGTVRLQLPAEVSAEEFGAKMTGTVELPFVGHAAYSATGTP